MPSPHLSSHRLFAYGSLMCADIMALVVGTPLASTPAMLPGFRRLCVAREPYPGLIADPDAVVAGRIYEGLTPAFWARLDAFEGAYYQRRPVRVRIAAGSESQVDCYLFRPEYRHLLTCREWDYAAFLRNGKAEFQRRYQGFAALGRGQDT